MLCQALFNNHAFLQSWEREIRGYGMCHRRHQHKNGMEWRIASSEREKEREIICVEDESVTNKCRRTNAIAQSFPTQGYTCLFSYSSCKQKTTAWSHDLGGDSRWFPDPMVCVPPATATATLTCVISIILSHSVVRSFFPHPGAQTCLLSPKVYY